MNAPAVSRFPFLFFATAKREGETNTRVFDKIFGQIIHTAIGRDSQTVKRLVEWEICAKELEPPTTFEKNVNIT